MSFAERLNDQFYEWEGRGRGWFTWPDAVRVEPPFAPFWSHTLPRTTHIDDGKHGTWLSSIADFFREKSEVAVAESENDDIAPFLFENDAPLCELLVSFPKGHKIRIQETELLLGMLADCQYHVSFEIIATHEAIAVQLVCREPDRLFLQGQLKAHFPQGIIQFTEKTFERTIYTDVQGHMLDYGLNDEFMRPLKMADSFEPDPYIGLFGILDSLQEGETGMLQILFSGTRNPWWHSILRSVTDGKGGPFFSDAPEMLPLAKEKIAKQLFGVVIRTIGLAATSERGYSIAESMGNALRHASKSTGNRLVLLNNEDYSSDVRLNDIFCRTTHRMGMLLNSRELANLVHFPSDSIATTKLIQNLKKTKAPPQSAQGGDIVIGLNVHNNEERKVTLTTSQRFKHTHIIGATGTGKSTLLLNLIEQDITEGRGVAVIDPHGDLIDSLFKWIPKHRYNDVIVLDPADTEFPVGLNVLSEHSETEKEILSSDLVAVFRRLSTSWGDQMNSVFANAILAFLESEQGGTLYDLRRFLVEKSFRDIFLQTVTDPHIRYYWQKEFPLLKGGSAAPILTRLDSFLRPKPIRNMVVQKKGLNFESILNTNKILLCKLSQGQIGAENSYLLGAFIVAKIHQAAMARQNMQKDERNPFFLYVDEFQNFSTPSMGAILSQARKYNLGLILAHQDMPQIQKIDAELASSVLSNAGTRICFRMGDQDARKFEEGFSYFEAKDISNLGTGEAIMRIERPEFDCNITTEPLPEVEKEISNAIQAHIVSLSREMYGKPKRDVEALIEDVSISLPIEPVKKIKEEKQPHEKFAPIERKPESLPVVELPKPIQREKPQTPLLTPTERQALSQHRYLQTFIKKMAESRGYKASTEEPTPDGKGRVDVALERNGKRIACEICVTTTDEWELHNIQKCLGAGYDVIAACSTEPKALEKIRKQIAENLSLEEQKKVLICEPDQFLLYLEQELAKEATTETRIRGYRVKVEYEAVSPEEMEQKQRAVAKAIVDSMQKLKK